MGQTVIATCECGYSSGNIVVGHGMIHRDTADYNPCLCQWCRQIFSGNMRQLAVLCPECGQETMPYPRGNEPVEAYCLAFNGQHECPACGKQTLTFCMGMYLWD